MTVAILVFDLSNKDSIYNIQNWLNSINMYCPKDIIIYLVAYIEHVYIIHHDTYNIINELSD